MGYVPVPVGLVLNEQEMFNTVRDDRALLA